MNQPFTGLVVDPGFRRGEERANSIKPVLALNRRSPHEHGWQRMKTPVLPTALACALALAAMLAMAVAPTASAAPADDVRARLEQWTEDFNAGRAEAVCDLFSRQAISNYRGQPERQFDEICGLLQDSLADPARDYHYELDIREIIVEGDLAVVRLAWTLFIAPLNITTVEPGMDVFRREADGKWRIIRYLAYEDAP